MNPSALVPVTAASADAAHSWLDPSLYPFKPQTFRTPDGNLSYVDEGHGPPVFLVHGTPSWSFEWRRVIAELKGVRRVVAPDHLGFGLSDKPSSAPYRPEEHARRLLSLFDRLDLHDVTLVVHDFGCPIGLPILLERPERVARLVVLNGFMWPLGDDRAVARLSRVVRSPFGRFLYRWLNVSPRVLLPASFGDRRRLSPAVKRQYLGPFLRRQERIAPWVLGAELTGSDSYYRTLWERRGALARVPVTLVWGDRDPAFGERHLARWLVAAPHAVVVHCADAGHFPQEEAPELVIDAIRGA